MRGSSATQANVSHPLRTTHGSDAIRIHFREAHDNPRQLGRVQEYVAKQQLIRFVVQPADNMTPIRGSLDTTGIFGRATLSTAIQGHHGKTPGRYNSACRTKSPAEPE